MVSEKNGGDGVKTVIKTLIRFYAYAISPLTGPSCRFHPTCSAFAMEAVDRHGAIKGGFLAIRRLLKCHPWHNGPFIDPVPGVDPPGVILYKRAETPENPSYDRS